MSYSIVINQPASSPVSDQVAPEAKIKKQMGNFAILKGNSFYGKMINDLVRRKST